jgi:hypothetical protein
MLFLAEPALEDLVDSNASGTLLERIADARPGGANAENGSPYADGNCLSSGNDVESCFSVRCLQDDET